MGIGGRTYGLIWPDRTPQPELYQVKKSAQPVHVELANPVDGIVEITNRYHFTNLNELKTSWQLQADGAILQQGILNLSVAPLEKAKIKIPYKKPLIQPGIEYRLLISFTLKDTKPYAPAGFEVAWDQLELPWNTTLNTEEALVVPDMKVNDANQQLTISGNDFEYVFSRQTGQLVKMKYNGKELIREGAKLSVWRAPLANDLDNWATRAANLQPRKPAMGTFPAGSWYTYGLDNLNFRLDKFTILSQENNKIVFEIKDHAEGINYSTAFDNNYVYTITGTGEMTIDHTVTPQGMMPLWLPKIGVQWIMDKSLGVVSWYGRGPFETYPAGGIVEVKSVTFHRLHLVWVTSPRPIVGGTKLGTEIEEMAA